jgi:arginine deiminase
MDYSKYTKAELIEFNKQKDEIIASQSDYEKIKKEHGLFLKGTKEKDQQIASLSEQVENATKKMVAKAQEVADASNLKVAQLNQQQVALATELEFSNKGNIDITETLNDVMEINELMHQTTKKLVSKIKSVYVKEE